MSLNKKLKSKLREQTKGRKPLKLSELPHFNQMLNCVSAAKLLLKFLMNGKRGIVIGDYDVDGIEASAILIDGMRKIGFTEEVFASHIPSRIVDGYGLSIGVVKRVIEQGYDFIVTVDNGIAAVEAIKYARDHEIDVIITDHHTAPAILPNANIIVCPKQPGETFPFIDISGATVAWYFLAAIKDELNFKLDMTQYLDWVALTIMSDVMPLDNINLTLLNYGLNLIKQRKRYLYQLVWSPEWTDSNDIDETALSFGLIPMLNAVGRIDDANKALRLMLSTSKPEIKELFTEVKAINEKRKILSRENTLNAEKIVDTKVDTNDNVIVVQGDYHEGVVGIIAGRLAEKYKKPTYVMSWNKEKNLWKGSARTSGHAHLYEITAFASEFTVGFGGHAGACGFSITEEMFSMFKAKLIEFTGKLNPDDFINHFLDPIECNLGEINSNTFKIVREFAPYGQSNPMPSFISTVKIIEASPLSNGLHWKCKLIDEETEQIIPAMMFNVHPDNIIKDGRRISLTADSVKLKYNLARVYDKHSEEFKIEVLASFINK